MKEKIIELRVKIDGLSQLVKELKPIKKSTVEWHDAHTKTQSIWNNNSSEIEKSYDSLILAKAWLGKILGELGQETPYKNDGKRKEVKDIEETADTCNPPKTGCRFEVDWSSKFHIEKVDWLRQEIKKVASLEYKLVADMYKEATQLMVTHIMFSYRYLYDARFWLGFELQRIKEIES